MEKEEKIKTRGYRRKEKIELTECKYVIRLHNART